MLTDDKKIYILNKLIYLESHIGHKVNYTPFYCEEFRAGSTREIQDAANKIAQYMGLGHIKFFINSNVKMNTAGNIHYDESNTCFINLSSNLDNYISIVAVLAHEISHKFLQLNHLVESNTTSDNEVLTDLTAIYLGFGPYIYFGYEGARITLLGTYNYKMGYISKEEINFVIEVLCKARNISFKDYLGSFHIPYDQRPSLSKLNNTKKDIRQDKTIKEFNDLLKNINNVKLKHSTTYNPVLVNLENSYNYTIISQFNKQQNYTGAKSNLFFKVTTFILLFALIISFIVFQSQLSEKQAKLDSIKNVLAIKSEYDFYNQNACIVTFSNAFKKNTKYSYHRYTCPYLNLNFEAVVLDIDIAEYAGYTPCNYCMN